MIACLMACVPTERSIDTVKPANVILIYTDDMGIGDVGYTGGAVSATPHIDRMARKGKVFTQYYTPAPVCSPSRVAVLTGMYHIRWGIYTFLSSKRFNRNTTQQDYLDSDAPSLGRMMKSAGYKTAHFGKWHMGGGRDVIEAPPISHYGFDEFSSTWESPNPDPLLTSSNWIWATTDSIKRWERTAYFVDKTLEFIKRNDGPCFVNLWPDDVHSPWVPSEDAPQEDKRVFYTLPNLKPVVSEYDRQMGRLLDELTKINELENTLIIFTSDNGPDPSFARLRTNGLRGVKNGLYEGGVKMPMIMHWPKVINPGQQDDQSVIASIDLLPTLAYLTGVGYDKRQVDGKNIANVILGEEIYSRDRLYFEYGRNEHFRFPKKEDRSLSLAVRSGDWKLFSNIAGDSVELYNLRTDPTESNNLVEENGELVASLQTDLLEWFIEADKSHCNSLIEIE